MVMVSLPLDLRSVPHELVDIQGQQALNVVVIRLTTDIIVGVVFHEHTRRRSPSVDDDARVAMLAAGHDRG